MQYRVGHLAYKVKDMKASLDFYCNCLGYKHLFSIPGNQGEPWIEYLGTPDGKFIELFHPTGDGELPAGAGYLHLCLEVDDCAAAVEELKAKGADVYRNVSQGKDGNYQAWVHDPDGREIEIMQLAGDSEQAKYHASLK